MLPQLCLPHLGTREHISFLDDFGADPGSGKGGSQSSSPHYWLAPLSHISGANNGLGALDALDLQVKSVPRRDTGASMDPTPGLISPSPLAHNSARSPL